MKRRTVRVRRLSLLLVALLLSVAAAGAATADDYEPVNPPFPDPGFLNPQLKVTPSDALVHGQTVMVTGRFFGANSQNGVLRQCTVDRILCDVQTTSFTTGHNGEFNPIGEPDTEADPQTIPVPFTVRSTFTAVGGATVDCLATACVLFARWADDFDVRAGAHHLNFLFPGAGRYTPLTPARILDTRLGIGGISAPLAPGATAQVQVTGQGGVPATGVSTVVMNVTVTQPTGDGYLTVYPTGSPQPNASNLNFTPGKTVPNLVVVKLGTNGRVSVFNSTGSTHVIFDVAGYYSDNGVGNAGRYQPLVPARIADTRFGTGSVTLGPGASFDLQVSGAGGVPVTGVQAAVLNVAVTNTTAVSFLTVYPTGEPRPNASNLNWAPNDTVSNRMMTKLGADGRVTIFNSSGSTDVIVDVGGWYTDGSQVGRLGTYVPLVPARILDTRLGIGGITGPVPANGTVQVQVTGQGGVPATGVRAVILNATVVGPAGMGYLTIFPTGAPQPNASDLNYAPGETRANLVVVRVGTGGRVSLFTSAATHVLFDVAGWFS